MSNLRTFTQEDQEAFAKLSGDCNPLHVDPLVARRLLFGTSVVHGIHAALWSLDTALENQLEMVEVQTLNVTFPKPIPVGAEVVLTHSVEGEQQISAHIQRGQSIVATLSARLVTSSDSVHTVVSPDAPEASEPRELADSEFSGMSGELALHLPQVQAQALFPNLARCLRPDHFAMLLATTRLVGMQCPGMHSLFSSLKLERGEVGESQSADVPAMHYEVQKFDARFARLTMTVGGAGLDGTILGFRRPSPQAQALPEELTGLVSSREFSEQRALIIGGSRGLGEVVAKLLGAGGADVRVTYYRGQEDAERVCAQITQSGGTAKAVQFDVLSPAVGASNVLASAWSPTHLYYFATPFIFDATKGRFSAELFKHFCDYYVHGLAETVRALQCESLSHLFYPSSVAIDEVPAHMGEYAAAKAASEVLCQFLSRTQRKMKVHVARFPRMATDQTASVLPLQNENTAAFMLGLLRKFITETRAE